MPQISVIVPVYRVEAYLQRCVDSILAQTYTDFELILVDDGSPDGSGAMCDAYMARDGRVHVIHQSNAGLSAARNAGLDWAFAHGDSRWFTFVDSDDWVHPVYLEYLLEAAGNCGADVAACHCMPTDGEPLPQAGENVCRAYAPEEYYFLPGVYSSVAWGKLYRRECFEHIRFPVGRLHEDEFTTYRILFKLRRVALVDLKLYAYYRNAEGIMRGTWTPRRLDRLDAISEQVVFLEKMGLVECARRRCLVFMNCQKCDRAKLMACQEITKAKRRRYLVHVNRLTRRMLMRSMRYGWYPYSTDNSHKDTYAQAFRCFGAARWMWGRIVKPTLKRVPGVRWVGRHIRQAWALYRGRHK